MRLKFLILFFPLTLFGQKSIVDQVDPFIGTGGHGHTFPGSTMPFGMVQLSPDTRIEGWDGCSGYHYSDSIIYGFSTVLGLLLFSIAVSNADENQHQVYCEQSVKGEEVCESR